MRELITIELDLCELVLLGSALKKFVWAETLSSVLMPGGMYRPQDLLILSALQQRIAAEAMEKEKAEGRQEIIRKCQESMDLVLPEAERAVKEETDRLKGQV